LLLIIFWYTGSPALVIVQHAITPSIGESSTSCHGETECDLLSGT
jgi:hypothetical protein